MTNDQITALAREYAESDGYGLQIIQDDAEMFLRWLSRRFCLVEKSKLDELEISRRAKENGAVCLTPAEVRNLFPEIAKEVEG